MRERETGMVSGVCQFGGGFTFSALVLPNRERQEEGAGVARIPFSCKMHHL